MFDLDAIDLDEVVGVPLFYEHDKAMRLGNIAEAWIEAGELRATLRFSDAIAGQAAFQLVQRGGIGVSIGSEILSWEPIDDDEDNFVVTDWAIREVSLCKEPLDPGARVHGFALADVRARMSARQRMIERQGSQWSCRYDDDLNEDGLIRASVRVPDPRLVLYGKPELFV